MSQKTDSEFFRKYGCPTKFYNPIWSSAANEPVIDDNANIDGKWIQAGVQIPSNIYMPGHSGGLNRFPGTYNLSGSLCFAVCVYLCH